MAEDGAHVIFKADLNNLAVHKVAFRLKFGFY